MCMISLHIQFLHRTTGLLTEHTYAVFKLLFHLSVYDFVAIFGCPDQMILAMPQNVCYLIKSAHAIAFLSVGAVEKYSMGRPLAESNGL